MLSLETISFIYLILLLYDDPQNLLQALAIFSSLLIHFHRLTTSVITEKVLWDSTYAENPEQLRYTTAHQVHPLFMISEFLFTREH